MTDKNNLPIKVCFDCKKDSNNVDFHMKKTGKPCYYSKRCSVCQNAYRISLKTKDAENKICIDCKTENKGNNFEYYSLPDKKIFHSRCKKCTIKQIEKEKSSYIPERFCWRCEQSSNDKEFRSKIYSNIGKEYYINHCIECEKDAEYERFIKKYNLSEIKCKFCKVSSLSNYFSHYKFKNRVMLYPFCFNCTDKNTDISPTICNTCNKTSDEVDFVTRDVLNKNGYETIYNTICRDCNKKKRKKEYNKYESKLKKYKIGAITRDYEWLLTDEEAGNFFKDDCFYCGKISIENEDMSGIDRVDNKIGYTLNNCVSCCGMCNGIKGTFSKEEFINKCIEVAKIHGH